MMLKLGTFAAMVVALSPGFQCSGLSRQVNPEYNFVMDFKNHVHGTQRCREPGNTEVLEDVFGIDKYSWDDFADPGSKKDGAYGDDLSDMEAFYYFDVFPLSDASLLAGSLRAGSLSTGFVMPISKQLPGLKIVFTCTHGIWVFQSDNTSIGLAESVVEELRCPKPGNTGVLKDLFGIDESSWDDFADDRKSTRLNSSHYT
eukprot:35594_1